MQIQAVLFDLDNTLIDFLRMKRMASDAAARAMAAAGADFPFRADEAGDILFGDYLEDLEGDQVFERFLRKHHRQKLSLSQHAVDRITAAAVNAYLHAKQLHLEPYPGVRRTLLRLARMGVGMGVLTDAPRFKAYQRLDAAGLVDFFDVVLTHDPGAGGTGPDGAARPERPERPERPFREALDLFSQPPQAVLMVGDRGGDVEGARRLGMPTAWAKYGHAIGGTPPQCDFVLESFGDLLRVVALRKAEA